MGRREERGERREREERRRKREREGGSGKKTLCLCKEARGSHMHSTYRVCTVCGSQDEVEVKQRRAI